MRRRLTRGHGERIAPSFPVIIYLDQSRVSEIVRVKIGTSNLDQSAQEIYRNIYRILCALVESGKALCPFSLWHVVESIRIPHQATLNGIGEFFDVASRQKSLRFFYDMFDREISAVGPLSKMPYLGDSLSCFPGIQPLTRDYFIDRTGDPFTAIMQFLHGRPELLEMIASHRGTVLAQLRKYIDLFNARVEPTDVEIRTMLRGDFLRFFLKGLIERGTPFSRAHNIYNETAAWFMDDTWSTSRVRSLGSWIDLFVARIRVGGEPDTSPRSQGDAEDLCHMAHLAAVDVFFTERKFATLGERAARLLGTKLLFEPAEFLRSLERLA